MVSKQIVAQETTKKQIKLKGISKVWSATSDIIQYFVRAYLSSFGYSSCKNYKSNVSEKRKHQYATESTLRMGTLKETDILPVMLK